MPRETLWKCAYGAGHVPCTPHLNLIGVVVLPLRRLPRRDRAACGTDRRLDRPRAARVALPADWARASPSASTGMLTHRAFDTPPGCAPCSPRSAPWPCRARSSPGSPTTASTTPSPTRRATRIRRTSGHGGGGFRAPSRASATRTSAGSSRPRAAPSGAYAPDLWSDPRHARGRPRRSFRIAARLVAPVRARLAASTGTLAGALTGALWGGLVRIFLLHHVTWTINSVCHFFGRRRFATEDESRNVFWLAPLSFGESWHHNHHAFPTSAFHGLKGWELDPWRAGDPGAGEARAGLERRADLPGAPAGQGARAGRAKSASSPQRPAARPERARRIP